MLDNLRPIDNKKVIGRGTWYDKAADELIKREKKLKRSLDKIRTESGRLRYLDTGPSFGFPLNCDTIERSAFSMVFGSSISTQNLPLTS